MASLEFPGGTAVLGIWHFVTTVTLVWAGAQVWACCRHATPPPAPPTGQGFTPAKWSSLQGGNGDVQAQQISHLSRSEEPMQVSKGGWQWSHMQVGGAEMQTMFPKAVLKNPDHLSESCRKQALTVSNCSYSTVPPFIFSKMGHVYCLLLTWNISHNEKQWANTSMSLLPTGCDKFPWMGGGVRWW